MIRYPYLIVGGGLAAHAAIGGIRQNDSSAGIGILSDEQYPPYNRPPLSKALWKGDPFESVWRKINTDKVVLHQSRSAVALNPENKTVTDNEGEIYAYEKLLLATGVRVRKLPIAVEGLLYYRTLDDYQRLRLMTEQYESFVVIGGGFIGSEIAAALAMNHKTVTMIFPEATIGSRVYPPALAQFLNGYYSSKGVRMLGNENIVDIRKHGARYMLFTASGKRVECDGVIAGIGVQPNQELAGSAGLQTDVGILVDDFLRTSHPDIFAAGDVAKFYNKSLDRRMRVEHEDNAKIQGEIAGKNMAGGQEPYHHFPFFYSDLFELGYEAVGELNPKNETIEDWRDPFHEGVVYYIDAGRVRGVLLWNTWGQVDAARALIMETGAHTVRNLIKRLPA